MDYEGSKFPKPKKKKRGPSKKRPKPGNMTSRLDALARKIVRARDVRCVICGSQEGLEVSHYLGRANMGVRWYLDNINLQCHKCHRDHHNGDPSYMRYMQRTYGDGVFEELYAIQQSWIAKGGASAANKEEIYNELTETWEGYKNAN